MGILGKHLGKGEPIKIGDDEILLKSLSIEDLPDFFKAIKAFSGASEDGTDMFKNVDDAGLDAMKRIITKTLEKSLPDEPEKDRNEFGLKYMMILLPKIMEINMQTEGNIEQKKKTETIKRLQEKAVEARKKETADNGP